MTEKFQLAPHIKVMRHLEDKGFETYLVGGTVRDQVLGRTPKDYDVTTNALPEQVQALFSKTVTVGAKFGVVIVVQDGEQIEVATYRADGAYTDGRRPDTVSYSKTAKDDVVRRDFTMNGLLWELDGDYDEGSQGCIDYVGGLQDIKDRVIRCIGDPNVRFAEDALRMLRALRFAAQLDFTIEEKTLAAIAENAALLRVISRERVAAELYKIFSSSKPLNGLIPFITTGLYQYALPEEFATHANMVYMLQRFGNFQATNDPKLGMGMFFADIGSHADKRMAEYLKFSNAEANEYIYLNSHLITFRWHLKKTLILSEADLKRKCRLPGLSLALEILPQDELMGKTNFGIEAVMDLVLKIRAYKPEDIKPPPLVTGADLIQMGLTPGPTFTEILDEIETLQLNGEIDRETALKRIQEKYVLVTRETLTEIPVPYGEV